MSGQFVIRSKVLKGILAVVDVCQGKGLKYVKVVFGKPSGWKNYSVKEEVYLYNEPDSLS